jgi:methylenetetrahydrofolate--tRNA-(uracil-5-)-methyltransferase
MHRNTYLKSPKILYPTYQTKNNPEWFFAGQMTGVEGYIESTASGWLAGVNAARFALDQPLLTLPPQTIMGSMAHYITHADPEHFQPMNANFGIVQSDLPERAKDKKEQLATRALELITALKATL